MEEIKKSKKSKVAIFGVVLAILALGLGGFNLYWVLSNEANLKGSVDGLSAEVSDLKSQVDQLKKENEEAADEINNLSVKVEKVYSGEREDETDEILADEISVEFGKMKVTLDEDGECATTSMTIKLTNKTSERKTYNLVVEATDKNGDRIDTDYAYFERVAAGQTIEGKVFTYDNVCEYDSSWKEEWKIANKLKNATDFTVIEASRS